MGDNRPARYVEDDGRVIYRASSLGMCDKVFVALAMGYDPKAHPAWFQEILDEGSAAEETIRDMWMEQHEAEVQEVGKVLEMEILDGVWIRGSIDGWVETDGIQAIWDAKKIRDSGWARYERVGVEVQANYPFQFSAYMHMWHEMFDVMPDFIMAGGHYVQDDKTLEWSVTEVSQHIYQDPMVNLMALKRRIVTLERLINGSDAIGEVACTSHMYPCPFFYLHDEDDKYEPPTRPSDDVVAPLLTEWDELEQQKGPLNEAVKKLKTITDRQSAIKLGVKAWLELSGQESGAVSTIKAGEVEYAAKYLVSPRAGYTVDPTEQTRVTIKATKRGSDVVAKAPNPSRKRGALAPKTDTSGV